MAHFGGFAHTSGADAGMLFLSTTGAATASPRYAFRNRKVWRSEGPPSSAFGEWATTFPLHSGFPTTLQDRSRIGELFPSSENVAMLGMATEPYGFGRD